jgi:hypothetical protein
MGCKLPRLRGAIERGLLIRRKIRRKRLNRFGAIIFDRAWQIGRQAFDFDLHHAGASCRRHANRMLKRNRHIVDIAAIGGSVECGERRGEWILAYEEVFDARIDARRELIVEIKSNVADLPQVAPVAPLGVARHIGGIVDAFVLLVREPDARNNAGSLGGRNDFVFRLTVLADIAVIRSREIAIVDEPIEIVFQRNPVATGKLGRYRFFQNRQTR